jgi:hypothetical protein
MLPQANNVYEKIFLTPDLAERLKDLGFDEPCISFWQKHDSGYSISQRNASVVHGHTYESISHKISGDIYFLAPTLTQAIDFLSGKCVDIIVYTDRTINEILGYTGEIRIGYESWKILGETIEDNYSYTAVMNQTIGAAITILEKLNLQNNVSNN